MKILQTNSILATNCITELLTALLKRLLGNILQINCICAWTGVAVKEIANKVKPIWGFLYKPSKRAGSWAFLSYKEPNSKPLSVAGRGLQEGFHIWLNYEPFAV